MSEEKPEYVTFTDEQKERINQIVSERLARERERWEKEQDPEYSKVKAELEAKDAELAQIKQAHFLEATRRAMRDALASRGITEAGRVERIERLVDLTTIEADAAGSPDRSQILKQLDGVASDVPELVTPRGAGSGGSRLPLPETEEPLTREDVEGMTPEQVNSNWGRVQAFLRGER